jgi:hypothetical protein
VFAARDARAAFLVERGTGRLGGMWHAGHARNLTGRAP